MTSLIVSEIDYSRLNSLLENDQILRDLDAFETLESELDRAEVVDLSEIPHDLITMNTRFSYKNLTDNKISEMTIVYPQHTDLARRWISVTAPLGAAFLGLKEGSEIDWEFPDGKVRTLRVLKVLYQPEQHGDFHL